MPLIQPGRVVLKNDRVFSVSDADGAIRSESQQGHGLWLGDTRILSEYRLRVNGAEPKVADRSVEWGCMECLLTAGPLRVHLERYVDGGLHDRITLTNEGSSRAGAAIDLVFAADFAAMLSVRGVVPPLPSATVDQLPTGRGVLLQERSDTRRSTEIVVRPADYHRVEFGAGEQFVLHVDVLAEAGNSISDFDAGAARVRDRYRAWAGDCAGFESDNPALNELIEQARDDLRMLCDEYQTGTYPTAGLPWFAVPFGRDALITSMFALPVNPSLARGSLRYLAAHQGRAEDPRTQEQPGKILHEVRTGQVVDAGAWPHILYAAGDATPLFLAVLGESYAWTQDGVLADELQPSADRALGWCMRFLNANGNGWIDGGGGHGWKDSYDSLTHADGSPPPRPSALCEVQAYLYRGLLGMARRRPELAATAQRLKQRFNRDFWMERERYVAQALDGAGRQVTAITSNPGHCLWAGILPEDGARDVARRLVAPDLFSGWGVRTLSNRAVNYDPCSYHNGSVWPHDCALAAAGMLRTGCEPEAERLARAILEAGAAFPDRRLPELWCGADRRPAELPDDYRTSCSPQSWAAASTFSLLATLLGLRADAPHRRLYIAPLRTRLFKRTEVRGLHFAGDRIDFAVDGERVSLGRIPPGLEVVTTTSQAS